MSIYVLKNQHGAKGGSKTDVLSSTRDFQNCKLRRRPMVHALRENHLSYDVFYEDHKPIISLLRIMGVMPIQRTEAGNNNSIKFNFLLFMCRVNSYKTNSHRTVQIYIAT
jgi:hypothetical protein